MTARDLYERNLATPSDIGGHMPTLLSLGLGSMHITEFGVRGGNSTSCWLAAHPRTLHCYDLAIPPELDTYRDIASAEAIDFAFAQLDTSTLPDIAETDLLFCDTLHTADQLTAELRHADRVLHHIVLHDTEANAWHGERGAPGLLKALVEFLLAHTEWRISAHHRQCNGLTVLTRA